MYGQLGLKNYRIWEFNFDFACDLLTIHLGLSLWLVNIYEAIYDERVLFALQILEEIRKKGKQKYIWRM